jgi:hypothetical protein
MDRAGSDAVYFQNSELYKIHYEFASAHLSGGELPLVPELATFNSTEYYTPSRRFALGAVTYYAEPDVWALEIAPYDTATAELIGALYGEVRDAAYFGPALVFHPTSEAVAVEAARLDGDVPVVTTDQLYAETSYQPLTLGTAVGRLHFARVSDLDTEYLAFDDIVVLDEAPNDISVVRGLVTEQFQTPLSHVNILSQNRQTPNMGLRGAMTNPELLALDGELVELTVGANAWSVRKATRAEADAFWESHKPQPIVLPALNLDVRGLHDIEDVTPEPDGTELADAIAESVRAFGGKAAQYSILYKTDDVPVRKAFAVPMHYYHQFMTENGLFDRMDALLGEESFKNDPAVRDSKLAEFREAMHTAPVDEALQVLLREKLEADYPGLTMRFRTSTNSEDLDGFPCAGCYESHTGDPNDWEQLLTAVRETWASIWLFRTFEEREYHGIDHQSVGMALLVHHNYPFEEANGVAVTNNIFDSAGLEPAFYINVLWGGEAEVVSPPTGITSDQFLYFYSNPNQPTTYLTHSNLVPEGETVLSGRQIHDLGMALEAIHRRFSPAFGPASGNTAWYAMDVEFKFDDEESPGEPPALSVKQARPYHGRGAR